MMPRSPHVGVVLGIVLMSAGVESVDLAFGRDYYVANRAASGAANKVKW